MNKTCILVLGMHRSGTSALAGLLHSLGVNMGKDLLQPTWCNPKGFYENRKIMLFNEYKLFPALETFWHDVNTVDWSRIQNNKEALFNEAKTIVRQTYPEEASVFGMKDPRMCLLLPFWEEVLLSMGIEIKVLFIYRNPLEVAMSLLHRDNFPLDKGFLLWSKYVIHAEYYSRKFKRAFIDMDTLLNEPQHLISVLQNDFFSLEILDKNSQEFDREPFLEKKLKHFSFTLDDLPKDLPEFVRIPALYLELICKGQINFEGDLKEKFDLYRNQYQAETSNLEMDWLGTEHKIRVFFDGSGFSENNSVLASIKPVRRPQEISVDLPSNPKGLRFELPYRECKVEVEAAKLIDSEGKHHDITPFLHTNAESQEDTVFYFLTNKPHIYISGGVFENKSHTFKNSLLRLKISRLTVGDELKKVRQQRDDLQSRLAEVEDELKKVRQQRDDLQSRLAEVEDELKKARQQRDDLQSRLAEVEDELVRIYLSKSWAVTRPLRWLGKKVGM